ncbi:MAG TPA: EAL domain-containing protein, partial [Gemmatimonadaceae bacterium]
HVLDSSPSPCPSTAAGKAATRTPTHAGAPISAVRGPRSPSFLSATLEAINTAVLSLDLDDRVTGFNQQFVDLWRLSDQAVRDAGHVSRIREEIEAQLTEPRLGGTALLAQPINLDDVVNGVLELVDGRIIELFSRPQQVDSVIVGRVFSFSDVTHHRIALEQLAYRAHHDPLTGLANRSLFLDRVAQALVAAPRRSHLVAILFLDLDGFKDVNDSVGHAEGDRLLVQVAERLATCVRPGDVTARLGGDEFAVLLENTHDVHEIIAVAERIGRELGAPFLLDGTVVHTTASVGIATSAHASTPDALLRNADVAMYDAKARHRGHHAVFEPAMHAAALIRLQLDGDLRRAIEQEQFCVYYQPIVRLATGTVVGAEALVRWRHPERGIVSPLSFVPFAEETGLIVPLGRWVLREACLQAQRWSTQSTDTLSVTVNLSARQLRDAAIVDTVRAVLEESALPPGQLVLEITESVLIQHAQTTLETLCALKALGVMLAIDDFGTGYSSLSYLHRFPIDVLKIDKAFVDPIGDESQRPALARAIASFAQSLQLKTVAEGVERANQAEALRALGCELGQGYFYCRPLPAEEFTEWLGRTTS